MPLLLTPRLLLRFASEQTRAERSGAYILILFKIAAFLRPQVHHTAAAAVTLRVRGEDEVVTKVLFRGARRVHISFG
jgi:hypothetical protein